PLYLAAISLITGPFERRRTRIKFSSSIKIAHALIPSISPKVPTTELLSIGVILYSSKIASVIFILLIPIDDNLKFFNIFPFNYAILSFILNKFVYKFTQSKL